MLALESIALIGFVLHVADLAPRHPFRALRHTLPLLPAAPLVHPVHDVLIASPIIADFATAVRWTLDTTAWVAAGLLTATAVGIAWVAWETCGDTLRNRQAWVLARIDRERTREMQRIRVDQARARAELDVREAQVAAVREANTVPRVETQAQQLHQKGVESHAANHQTPRSGADRRFGSGAEHCSLRKPGEGAGSTVAEPVNGAERLCHSAAGAVSGAVESDGREHSALV
jgi:hypothetical protein